MKKFTMIGLVIVLLAFSAVPVLAAGGNHGQGNGSNAGQNSNGGERNQNKGQASNHGRGNQFNASGTRGQNNANSKRMRTPFYLQGTIESINTTAMTVTVQVVHGNAQVKQFVGAVDMPITIVFTGTTKIFRVTQAGDEDETETAAPAPSTSSSDDETPASRVAITTGIAGLKVGDIVAIHGNVVQTIANNVVTRAYDATLVTVFVREATGQPEVETP